MKLLVPNNIFTSIFLSQLNSNPEFQIIEKESALICGELENDTSAVALIPSLELINHRTLFVSGKLGVSFDGVLSNAYLFFRENEKNLQKIKVRGDISINEIVLTKILFSERFSSKVEISLDPGKTIEHNSEYLVVGNENFDESKYETGISFSDLIAELIDLPYVNFVFVSHDKDKLEQLNNLISDIDLHIEENINGILEKINYQQNVKKFIQNNLGSVYFEITQNEVTALNELLKLIYYHGIIDDIFDIKFIY